MVIFIRAWQVEKSYSSNFLTKDDQNNVVQVMSLKYWIGANLKKNSRGL